MPRHEDFGWFWVPVGFSEKTPYTSPLIKNLGFWFSGGLAHAFVHELLGAREDFTRSCLHPISNEEKRQELGVHWLSWKEYGYI